jgi:hypothetical protein
MKKLITFLSILLFATTVTFGQSFSRGFLKPVTLTGTKAGVKEVTSVWLFRPAVELSAVQLIWNKETKQFDANAFHSAGLGVGYQHYVNNNGTAYNNFGFNIFALFDATTTASPATISVAGTADVLKFISLGAGYNFGAKQFFFLTGVTYNF